MTRHRLSGLTALLLLGSVSAQVPPGAAIACAIGNSNSPLLIVERGLGASIVTGSSAATIGAVKLDPIDGSVWIGHGTTADLRRLRLTGNVVTSETIVAPALLTGAGANGIAFDVDGNAVVAAGDPSTTGGLFRVDRTTSQVTRLVGPTAGIASGICNAIDSDPVTGDLWFGVTGLGGRIYKLPAPGYTTPILVGTVSPPTVSNVISGLAFARRPSAPNGVLLVSTFGSANNSSLASFDVATSLVTVIAGVPALPDLNWVAYDERHDDLWLLATTAGRRIYTADFAGNNATQVQLVTGAPAALDVSDSAIGQVVVVPSYVPGVPAPITLELGVTVPPGQIGLIAIVAPVGIVLASSVADASGRVAVRFPNLTVFPGTPNAVQLLGAAYDPATQALTLGSPVGWPRN